MTAGDSDYGSRLWRLWRADLRDRLTGNAARANARWGFLRPPAGRGKLLWIVTGAGREAVRLAVDALCALRARRQDLRLVLSFEHEYPDLLERARDLDRTAVGYGLCDAPAAVRRALKALVPFGVVFVRHAPRPNLVRRLADTPVHTVALNCACVPGRFEAAYPANRAQALAWREAGSADHVAAPADFETLLVEAQVDPNFRSLVCGGNELQLWWMHGLGTAQAAALAASWRRSLLAERGVLFLAPPAAVAAQALEQVLPGDPARLIRLSRWTRGALPPGAIVLVDEDRWLPAIAASVTAAHFFAGASSWALWHALAGGAPVSLADPALYACFAGNGAPQDEVEEALAMYEDLGALIERWQAYAADPLETRRAGDRARRLFWHVRRRAQATSADFLQRVYDW